MHSHLFFYRICFPSSQMAGRIQLNVPFFSSFDQATFIHYEPFCDWTVSRYLCRTYGRRSGVNRCFETLHANKLLACSCLCCVLHFSHKMLVNDLVFVDKTVDLFYSDQISFKHSFLSWMNCATSIEIWKKATGHLTTRIMTLIINEYFSLFLHCVHFYIINQIWPCLFLSFVSVCF